MVLMSLTVLLVEALVFHYSTADEAFLDSGKIPCDGENVEAYVDAIFQNISAQLPDRLPLPDRGGFLKLREGVVWGFPSLKRDGSAKVSCDKDFVSITAEFKVDELTGRYLWSMQGIRKERKGVIVITAKIFEVKIKMMQENEPGAKLNLDIFKITKMKGIDVEATGLNYLTWATSKLIDPIVELFRRSIARIIAGPIREALAAHLQTISIPLEW